MRRYTALLCAALLTVSLSACGKNETPAEDTAATTTTTITTTTTTEEPVKAPLNLTYAGRFSDGVAFVRYRDAEGVEQAAAIKSALDKKGWSFDELHTNQGRLDDVFRTITSLDSANVK